jgi:FAD/FMN-containing dehydrogenase
MLDAYGGAINRVPANATAFAHRGFLHHMQILAYWNDDADAPAARGWLAEIFGLLDGRIGPRASYRNYPSLAFGAADADERYFGIALPALRRLRSALDPLGVFNSTQGVPL